jgi:hypothetical protein
VRRVTQIWHITYGKDKAPRSEGTTPPILSLGTIMGVNDELLCADNLIARKELHVRIFTGGCTGPSQGADTVDNRNVSYPYHESMQTSSVALCKAYGPESMTDTYLQCVCVCVCISSCTVSRNTQERSRSICCRGKALRVTYSVCVCVCVCL